MALSRKFYNVLVQILEDTHDLSIGASALQADRVIAGRFGISESTARNWRRGKITQVSQSVVSSVLDTCEKIAPERVADLEFIGRLSHGVHEVKLAAEHLADELASQILSNNSTWHIYSGPLKMAFSLNADPECQQQLMNRASLVVSRVLEMGVNQTDIPCLSEVVRYSMHGWYVKGFFNIREASLSSPTTGISKETIGAIEAALYMGDGCAGPSLYSGNPERAKQYAEQAISLLQEVDPSDARESGVELRDAFIMIRSMQTTTACHEGYEKNAELITQFITDFEKTPAQNEWIEGVRQEALGFVELCRRTNFAKAAYHFEQAGRFQDKWLSQFGIPFSSTAQQSLCGYALLMTHGPTDSVKAQMSEGLIRTIDYGAVSDQIRARLCQSLFYECRGEESVSRFHQAKARELARLHGLQKWCHMLNDILLPPNP